MRARSIGDSSITVSRKLVFLGLIAFIFAIEAGAAKAESVYDGEGNRVGGGNGYDYNSGYGPNGYGNNAGGYGTANNPYSTPAAQQQQAAPSQPPKVVFPAHAVSVPALADSAEAKLLDLNNVPTSLVSGDYISYGVLLNGNPVTDTKLENVLLEFARQLMKGKDVPELTLDKDYDFVYKGGPRLDAPALVNNDVISVKFFAYHNNGDKPTTSVTLSESDEKAIRQQFIVNMFEIMVTRRTYKPKTFAELGVPNPTAAPVFAGVPNNDGPVSVSGPDFLAGNWVYHVGGDKPNDINPNSQFKAKFQDIMNFLTGVDPQVANKIDSSIQAMTFSLHDLERFSFSDPVMVTDIYRVGPNTIHLALISFEKMNADSQVRTVLMGLFETLLNVDDNTRTFRAFQFVSSLYFWDQQDDNGVTKKRTSPEEFEKLKHQFAASARTVNLFNFVNAVENFRVTSFGYVNPNDVRGKQAVTDVESLLEMAHERARQSLNADYSQVFGDGGAVTSTLDEQEALKLAVWDEIQGIKLDGNDKTTADKLALVSEVVQLINNNEITEADIADLRAQKQAAAAKAEQDRERAAAAQAQQQRAAAAAQSGGYRQAV